MTTLSKIFLTLSEFISSHDGITSKRDLEKIVAEKFNLKLNRSLYINLSFAIRFSQSKNNSFSNTVLSLAKIKYFDDIPLMVCLVTPSKNYLFLINTTFIRKVSHSSHNLRVDNIKGSVNGSDILKDLNGLANIPENFEKLFGIHSGIDLEENITRIVLATSNIIPSGEKFDINGYTKDIILDGPRRTLDFCNSQDFSLLEKKLENQLTKYSREISEATTYFNRDQKLRGTIIEYLIVGDDINKLNILKTQLNNSENVTFDFDSKNSLGDYLYLTPTVKVAIDIKTKIFELNSNPKGYNIDKFLEFLSEPDTIFLFYFVGILQDLTIKSALVPVFDDKLLDATVPLTHWSGRNSRGVTQFDGSVIHELINQKMSKIDIERSKFFLSELINL